MVHHRMSLIFVPNIKLEPNKIPPAICIVRSKWVCDSLNREWMIDLIGFKTIDVELNENRFFIVFLGISRSLFKKTKKIADMKLVVTLPEVEIL